MKRSAFRAPAPLSTQDFVSKVEAKATTALSFPLSLLLHPSILYVKLGRGSRARELSRVLTYISAAQLFPPQPTRFHSKMATTFLFTCECASCTQDRILLIYSTTAESVGEGHPGELSGSIATSSSGGLLSLSSLLPSLRLNRALKVGRMVHDTVGVTGCLQDRSRRTADPG